MILSPQILPRCLPGDMMVSNKLFSSNGVMFDLASDHSYMLSTEYDRRNLLLTYLSSVALTTAVTPK